MTKEQVRFQVAVSVIQGIIEGKHGIIGEILPAAAVDEAFRIADEFTKKWFEKYEGQENGVPEPKAWSEDEEIRKDLISFVNKYYGEETKKEVLTYLEKQKGQKPAPSIYWHAIKEGDTLPCRAYLWTQEYEKYYDRFEGRLIPNVENITAGADMWYLPVDDIRTLPREGIDEFPKEQKPAKWSEEYEMRNEYGTEKYIRRLKSLRRQPKQKEQKPITVIPKFRKSDMVISTNNNRLTYRILNVGSINELGNPEYEVEIFTDGKADNPRNIHNIEIAKMDEWGKLIEQKPAECMVPPPSDPFMFNLRSTIYNFGKQIAAECLDTHILDTELNKYVTNENVDKHIKEYISCLVKYHPLQRPAEWSEKDEQYLLVCKNALDQYQRSDHWDASIISNWLEERLKSLRNRPTKSDTWKPSKEQIKAIHEANYRCRAYQFATHLTEIEIQLEKLMNE